MFTSYGETSGFSAVSAEELMLINGGKGSSGGGGGSGGGSTNTKSTGTKNTSTRNATPTTNTNINFKSAPSTQVYITDARKADALKPNNLNKTNNGVAGKAASALIVIATVKLPAVLGVPFNVGGSGGSLH
jgi:hypothetical protein